ncbi:PREDICTED: probable inactive receptor kinase At5g10020 [Theobroma cacao]|uniref:Probable inactive receptor kinase At5g10020 n=1 Tax=Theobroma cacao TaxID=3641 RepID=A0AB32WTF1_THECC|nr:PREDICTED: probable inactive receptor kinase At5g10020 [Theobroma cacao]
MQRVNLVFLLFLVVTALGQSDFEALLELKKGIEEDPSGKVLASWDSKSLASDGCPKNWFGVICTGGHVTSITLNDLGLVGNFSFPVIVGLKMLQNLSISSNQWTGTISNIGSILSLEFLDLSSNAFHGAIPSGIVNLKNLVLLNLSSNHFEGTFPSGFSNLKRLKYLDLRSNGFSGDIMNLLSQLESVVHVDLSSNQLSGSLDLGLGSSSFVSSIQYLNISHNLLVGELFAHDGMPYFDSLEVFDAGNNQLVGTIPSFNFIVSLRILRLGNNQLSGSLPEALLQESSMILSELDLSLNQLEGPVGSITSATLKKLNISSNKLSGSLPIKIGHCAILDLSSNMLSGDLSRIQGWGNYVEIIELSSNSLTGTLPNQTSQFLRLTTFKVSDNSLQGALPAVLGTYPELKVIDLSRNHLTGALLPSFFTSTKLTDLNLSGNNFTGSIPLQKIQNIPSVSSAENLSLVTLDLSFNSLSGHLPQEIAKFHNLEFLNLSNNKFEGSISDSLPDKLKGFNVSFNNFSGAIPDNLRRFPDSAFHPGNSFLRFGSFPLSPKGSSNLNLNERSSQMKPVTRIALIVGLVGGAAIIALVCVMIYYRTNWQETRSDHLKRNVGKETVQGEYSLPHTSAPYKSKDSSSSSFSFRQELLSSSKKDSVYDHGNRSSVLNDPKYFGHPESMRRDEELASPMSLLSSSNASPSKSQFQFESPGALKVRSPDKLAGDLHLFDGSLALTAEELSRAPAEVIGRSCHGTLYKATLDSGNILAIKWLKEGIAKSKKEFAREVKKLGYIKHPNLVSLQGYYWGPKEHEKLIVSNYINAQCLAFYLQETEPRKLPPLSLDERLRVAIDVARCLNYLHNERAIPHGNLKSTNILLESPNMTARLTDYSLHRILTSAGTAEQVLNAGALGYRPPEFASSSKPCPSLKSDVYAFGVILMELLTGKSSGEIVSGSTGVVDLTDWVRYLAAENRAGECFDPMISERDNVEHTHRTLDAMLQVALRCILPAQERPDMKSVYEDLSVLVL